MDTYYKECFVESVYHYKALENWQKFQIGGKRLRVYTIVDFSFIRTFAP